MDWMTVIRTRETEVGNNCTFGIGSWIGWAKIGNDVITGSHLVLLSGGRQHGFSNTSVPMRLQGGEKRQLQIDDDVWIGTRVVLMNDVASGTVIGAGSVVTRTFPSNSVIAGSPARLIRSRTPAPIAGDRSS
jgi:acetyltransferase-like isoleucine patch superfamily enzyme